VNLLGVVVELRDPAELFRTVFTLVPAPLLVDDGNVSSEVVAALEALLTLVRML
jgi:hypothetical protein